LSDARGRRVESSNVSLGKLHGQNSTAQKPNRGFQSRKHLTEGGIVLAQVTPVNTKGGGNKGSRIHRERFGHQNHGIMLGRGGCAGGCAPAPSAYMMPKRHWASQTSPHCSQVHPPHPAARPVLGVGPWNGGGRTTNHTPGGGGGVVAHRDARADAAVRRHCGGGGAPTDGSRSLGSGGRGSASRKGIEKNGWRVPPGGQQPSRANGPDRASGPPSTVKGGVKSALLIKGVPAGTTAVGHRHGAFPGSDAVLIEHLRNHWGGSRRASDHWRRPASRFPSQFY